MSDKATKINWKNTLFLTITPAVAIVGTIFLLVLNAIYWQTIVLAIIYTFVSGLAITAGYHRLFSHKSYKAGWPVRLFFILFGSAAFEGSVLEWCTDHRNHHRYTDTNKDPYNINQGFFYAHIGWLFTLDTSKRDFSNVDDLAADKMIAFQDRHYIKSAIITGFVTPMLIGTLWGDAIGALLIAGALRITINHHLTFFINSVCHLFGKQTYTDRNTARDNWLTALVTYGEGFHNFHHRFPIDYRNGIRYFHFDPSKWLIRGLAFCGLASDLKRVNEQHILQSRINHQQSRLVQLANSSTELKRKIGQVIEPIHASLQQAMTKVDELEKAYKELKSRKDDYVQARMQDYKVRVKKYKAQLQHARAELNSLLRTWDVVVESSLQR